ncbi:uncharacterized protein LOC132067103 [Lycium ferocissimum]|uniref:uncharacterized protein LOC132067103 n=1 Tax=Lycium ferocissimum TaxID=112874 RepID=UPI002814A82F|nr:uncharacterized protein LOC132067103 [Lycium ferocissimum]
MHASDIEAVELASYKLRDVAVYWYSTWVASREVNAPPPAWQEFVDVFLRQYLSSEIRQARADRFLNVRQGNMSAREYSLHFNSLSRYAPAMVADMGDRVHRFVNRLGPHLVDDMDISHNQAHAQNLEERQQQRRSERDYNRGYSKRARSSGAISEFREGQRQQYSRHSGQLAASPAPRFVGKRFDRPIYFRPGTDACYACGHPGHMMRNCPSRDGRGMVQSTGSAASSSSSVRPLGQSS